MKCKKCGREIKEGNIFCTYCGTSIKASNEEIENTINAKNTNIKKHRLPKLKIII